MAQQFGKPATTLREHGQVPRLISRDLYSHHIREECEEQMEQPNPSISGYSSTPAAIWEYLTYYWQMTYADLASNSYPLDNTSTSEAYQAWREYRFTLLALIYVSEGGSFHAVTGEFLHLYPAEE